MSNPSHPRTFSRDGLASGLLLPLYEALRLRGLDADGLLRQAQIQPEQLSLARSRIRPASTLKLWALADQAVFHDPSLAVDVAEQFNLRALGVLGMAWLASTSLREGLRRLVRYYQLVSSVAVLSLQQEGELSWLQYCAGPEVQRLTHDAWLGAMLKLCRSAYPATSNRAPFVAAGARLAHAGASPALADYLGCEPQAGAAATALAFTADQLDAPLPGGHPGLALEAEKVLAAARAALGHGDTNSQVRAILLDMLPSGDVSRTAVAQRMHMSERTLQRRLEAEHFSFAQLLQQTRLELAQNLLRDSEHEVQDVAFVLGFAEISSFTRAFRRWTGHAPSAWRVQQGSMSCPKC